MTRSRWLREQEWLRAAESVCRAAKEAGLSPARSDSAFFDEMLTGFDDLRAARKRRDEDRSLAIAFWIGMRLESHGRVLREVTKNRPGGVSRGRKVSHERRKNIDRIPSLLREYRDSAEAQSQLSLKKFLAARLGVDVRTVRNYLRVAESSKR